MRKVKINFLPLRESLASRGVEIARRAAQAVLTRDNNEVR
jgi:hypothetical protein